MMVSLNVMDKDGKELEKIKISGEITGIEPNSEVLYQEVRRYLASLRAGTHSTKGRSEVRGGGKKPWRQKGTGNARAGSTRSPIWKGGGIVFGPKPRDYGFKLNKKILKKSKSMALAEKIKNKRVIVLDKFDFTKPATKEAAEILGRLNVNDKKVLVVVEDINGNDFRSFRNLANVVVESANGTNAFLLMFAEYVIFTKNSLSMLIERLTNGKSKS
ncbi:MAG: 50S ribosomal protein L4 [Actinobacteria bacterium]|nr:50S ribosomal protein L4 [Actinomycetota bacterium]